jgi:hypothetical protein
MDWQGELKGGARLGQEVSIADSREAGLVIAREQHPQVTFVHLTKAKPESIEDEEEFEDDFYKKHVRITDRPSL